MSLMPKSCPGCTAMSCEVCNPPLTASQIGIIHPMTEEREYMTNQESSVEKARYEIKYFDNNHWCPEKPRIIDQAGNVLAICDDIDAADIILLALTRAQAPDATPQEAERGELINPDSDFWCNLDTRFRENYGDDYLACVLEACSTMRASVIRALQSTPPQQAEGELEKECAYPNCDCDMKVICKMAYTALQQRSVMPPIEGAFMDDLGHFVQYAFDNSDELMKRFYPSLNYQEFDEFYMSKSLCRLQVTLKEGASVSLVIATTEFLEWVEQSLEQSSGR